MWVIERRKKKNFIKTAEFKINFEKENKNLERFKYKDQK